MTRGATGRVLVEGAAGALEVVIDEPGGSARGVCLIAHPHPLFGGTLDNKVVQTLAKVFVALGYVAARPNFRGVGASAGEHDHGEGETDDMVRIAADLSERFGPQPLVLAGYSFGAFVQTRVARRVPIDRMVLVAPATGLVTGGRSYVAENVPEGTLVIHGDADDTVPLANVLDWARPQELPIVLLPGCDHFFHRKLHLIKAVVTRTWR